MRAAWLAAPGSAYDCGLMICLLFAVILQGATIQVEVRSNGAPLAGAQVVAAGVTRVTDAQGLVSFDAPAGTLEITVLKDGYVPVKTTLQAGGGRTSPVVVDLE